MSSLVYEDSDQYDIPERAVFEGTPISIDVSTTVSGGVAPYTFSAEGLPDGLTISEDGIISGDIPTAACEAGDAIITVSDSGPYATQTRSITIHYGAVSPADFSSVQIAPVENQYYTGSAIEPELGLTCNGIALVAGKDYQAQFTDNLNKGTATITLTPGTTFFGDSRTIQFNILARPIQEVTVTGIEDCDYTGDDITQPLHLSFQEYQLIPGTDYQASYENNRKAGRAEITITGRGNFAGTRLEYFGIYRSLEDAEISGITDKVYNGEAQTQDLTVTMDGEALEEELDYSLTYELNTDFGTALVYITGEGYYTGVITEEFRILRANVADSTVTGIRDKTYTGSAITQNLVVKVGRRTLTPGTDYSATYLRNTDAGTATVRILGLGNYTGSTDKTFEILPAEITQVLIEETLYYDASEKEPALTVRAGSLTVPSSSYDAEYSNNVEVGTAFVKVTGSGNFTGTVETTFAINRAEIGMVSVSGLHDQTYTGSPITQNFSLSFGDLTLQEGTDYTASYSANTDAGEAKVTLSGKGNFTGVATKTFRIRPYPINTGTMQGLTSRIYTGKAQTQTPVVKAGGFTLDPALDYTLSYKDNTNAGTAVVTATGKGNFTGSVSGTFTIGTATVAVPKARTGLAYTGSTQVGVPSGTGYTVTNGSAAAAGTYSAIVKLKDTANYTWTDRSTGPKTVKWSIGGVSLAKATVTGITAKTYTGKAQTQNPTVKLTLNGKTVTLKSGTDYTLKYENNTAAGTNAAVTIIGKGNFNGSIKKTFTINRAKVALPTAKSGLTYTGKSQTGVAAGTGYTVLSGSGTAAGTYTATVKLKDTKNYEWSSGGIADKKVKWTIGKANLKSAAIASIPNQTYEGTARKPTPKVTLKLGGKTVTLVKDTDYTLSYRNNSAPGTATVTVTGKGNFTGTASKTFKITQEKASFERLAGANRFDTAYAIADKLKEQLGVSRFDCVVVADGMNFPDALASAYLAKVKNAPILLTRESEFANTKAYIKANLKAGGKIYLVGGTGSLPDSFKSGLSAYRIKRLGGANRYGTNLNILKEAGRDASEMIVCTSAEFADALSASATGCPVLLVGGNSLTVEQKAYLKGLGIRTFYLMGSSGVISNGIQNDLAVYGNTVRISGTTQYERSVNLARKFFPGYQRHVMMASGDSFPDGLAGGPLAIAKGGPLLLVNDEPVVYTRVRAYVAAAKTVEGTIVGGETWISNVTAKMVLQIK
ncbi:MAG: cell wall-binding repeat-containing protein [Firmicutes bacterium]|nr:cell wall-binding repeat-containing protein [Bacillota bacterium]